MKQSLNWWKIPWWIYISGNIIFFITLIYTTIVLSPVHKQYEDATLIRHEATQAIGFFLVVLVLWFILTRFSAIKKMREFTAPTSIILMKKPTRWLLVLLGVTSFLALTALLS